MSKDGGREALDFYFHQIIAGRAAGAQPPRRSARSAPRRDRGQERSRNVISFAMTEEQEVVRDGDARLREVGAAAASRASATKRRRIPDAFLGQAGSWASTATQLPEAFGRRRRAALAGHERASCSRSSPTATPPLAIAAAAPSLFAYRRRRPGRATQQRERYLPPSAASATSGRGAGGRRAAARRSTRLAAAHARRAATGNGFVLCGAQVLRAARRSRQPLPGRRAQHGERSTPSSCRATRAA